MPGKKPPQASSGLKPESIFKLGESLSALNDFTSQEVTLKAFLKENFGGSAVIRFQKTNLSSDQTISHRETPFDIRTVSIGEPIEEHDTSFWVVSTLVNGQKEVGRIALNRNTPYSPTEITALSEIGMVAGQAVNATLQANLQAWRQKQLTLVRSVTGQISQITDLDKLTVVITRLIQETFNYYYVAIFLIEESSGRLRFKASAGSTQCKRPDFENPDHPGFDQGEHMIGFVAETGRELIANDVTLEPRYKEVDSLDNTHAEAVLPLRVEAEILGVFDVQSDKLNAFDEDDLLVLRALADNIAVAIKSTQLYQAVHHQAEQLKTVAEASRAITCILDTDELLEQIVSMIHDRFGFPYVHLYTVDEVNARVTFKAGSGERAQTFLTSGISFDMNAEKGVIPWVARQGETRRINDVAQEPLYLETPFAQDYYGSEMAVPLKFGGNVLGILDIQSDLKQAFSPEDQQIIETLADNIAVSIRNARLYRSEQWRRKVAESLRDVAVMLTDNTTQADILNAVLTALRSNLPCDIAAVWLFDPDSPKSSPIESRELYLAAYQTAEAYPADDLGKIRFLPDTWVKDALTQEAPTIRKPEETFGPIAAHYHLPQDYSSVAAPLHTGDEILGMLTLLHHTPGRYGTETQKIISAFASYAAVAIKNTRLFEASQEQAWVSTILLQVTRATQTQTNLDELVRTIVRLTPMVAGIKGCGLLLRDINSDTYSLQAMYGIGNSGNETDISQPILLPDAPLLIEMTLSQETLLVQDPIEDLGLPSDLQPDLTDENLILIPLIARNDVLGAFLLAGDPDIPLFGSRQELLNEERLNIIQGIIQQTAIAIENIQLLESQQEEAYVSAVLLQAAQAVVSSANLNDTLETIVNLMPILVGIDSCVIYLWDKTEEVFKVSHASLQSLREAEDLHGKTYEKDDFPMLETVYETNRAIVYPFIETSLSPEDWDLALPDEGQIDPAPILKTQFPLLMGFPLSVKNEQFGVLLAQDNNFATNRERRFELISGITQQASLAIQNDRLNEEMLDRQRLEREFQLAREIQQTFLPSQIPATPGWDMDVRWQPARQVGGDFYDYFLRPDGRLAFVIADVSNKGLAASLYMTVTRTLIRAAALDSDSPAETLEHVNDLLLMDSQNGLFVTVFYGLLDLVTGVLTFSIAGHNPPFVLRYEKKCVEALEKGGIALGALEKISLDEHTLELLPGDCLLSYTDGVTEAFNNTDQMYGDDRLKEVLQSSIGKPASKVLEKLDVDLEAFRGDAPLSDDTTILAICRSALLTD
ncbi:MAG: GAF domain-containing protein [Anaerolineaceae bacterium]|nr:GAF domain-containing protein [Anaerolineaceae bacterium]